MMSRTLAPDASEVTLECLKVAGPGQLLMLLRAVRSDSACPDCGTFSGRVHSRYLRKLSDLAWEGLPVRVQLRPRRFFCVRPECSRTIFAERLASTVARYGRRTCRLSRAYSVLAMALGGEAGARLASDLGIRTSGDSLLGQLRRNARSLSATSARVPGIDDWAWRKGHRYGTILCDLERGAVVDLLPDRDWESVQNWLRAHPGAELISRDRASAYAEAARKAAPKAVQVADRWHRLWNLSEALLQVLQPRHGLLTQAAKACAEPTIAPVTCANSLKQIDATEKRGAKMREASRGRRLTRCEAVMDQVRKGVSQAKISRTLGVDRRTIRRWSRGGAFPERKTRQRGHCVDRWKLQRQRCSRASPRIWRATRMPCSPLSPCPGAMVRLKASYIDSSSSNAPCTVEPTSTCCACASCNQRELTTAAKRFTP
jgi:DNA-binding transcriptional regulator YiaG